jgi:hypothetical protein
MEMYKKLLLIILLAFTVLLSSCHYGVSPPPSSLSLAERFSRDVMELTEKLLNSIAWGRQNPVVGLGSFFYADSRMSSDFAYHLTTEVEKAVINMPGFILVDRANLGDILNELGFQLTDLVDPETAKNMGKIKGLDAMLTGRYSLWEGKVRVKVELIRIEDAEMAIATRLIDSVPADVAILPPNYEVQRQRMEKIQDWFTERPDAAEQASSGSKLPHSITSSDFRATIEPDRMEGYKEGDELKLYVKSEEDCYIEIYNISEDGSTRQIFPNEHWLRSHSPDDNFIRAGVRTAIPPDPSFKLRISAPYGVETLKLIASTRPFGHRARSFYQEKGAFPEVGNIDDSQTVEILKYRARSVLVEPGSSEESVKVAQSYCTILTEPSL